MSNLQAVYAFTSIFFILGWNCTHESLGGCTTSRRTFSFFTDITFWGLCFYFAVAAAHTLSYILTGGRAALLSRLPRPLQALHSLFYTTVVTLPFLVTIVYWVVLFSGPWFPLRFNAWSNITVHALNSVFALLELVLPRTAPPPWVHLIWLIVILACYLGVAYLTLADQGWYTYSFLDHDKTGGRGLVAAWIFALAAGIIIVFAVVWGLIRLRVWVTEKKLGMQGKFVAGDSKDGRAAQEPKSIVQNGENVV